MSDVQFMCICYCHCYVGFLHGLALTFLFENFQSDFAVRVSNFTDKLLSIEKRSCQIVSINTKGALKYVMVHLEVHWWEKNMP